MAYLPFILGLAVGVVFNDQIRQGWQMLRGAVPQVPDIPSFGGGGGVPVVQELRLKRRPCLCLQGRL